MARTPPRCFGHNRTMKAMQIVEESGPDTALRLVELDDPEPSHMLTPGSGVAGRRGMRPVCPFPRLLQTRGQYQMKSAAAVSFPAARSPVSGAARLRGVAEGGRPRGGVLRLGRLRRDGRRPEFFTFALPDVLDFAQGASLILNYHTAYFSLVLRGRLKEGETVLVHAPPAASARPRCRSPRAPAPARSRSSPQRPSSASPNRRGPTRSLLLSDTWKDEVKERSGGGVDVVLDPVGGRPLHRQPALAARERARDRRRLHRRLDPRGKSQPAAAGQTRRSSARAGAPT